MDLQQFNTMLASVEAKQRAIFEKAKALKERGVTNLKEYEEIGALKISWHIHEGVVRKIEVKSDTLEYIDIEDVIETLKEFQNGYKLCDGIAKSQIKNEQEVGSEYIHYIGYMYEYYELSEERLESEIMRLCRELIKEELKPDGVQYAQTPDCKIVQLFRDGSIDWETLQRITYKDCEI